MFGDLIVVDFTRVVAGPYCTRMLADLGAQVIKIDALPQEFDELESTISVKDAANFRSAGGISNNLGKLSLSIDLKSAGSKDVINSLLLRADVVVENFKPGVMESLGYGPGACLEINPRLIYAGLSGFGQDSSRRAFGATAHAESGWLWVQKESASVDEIFAPGVTVADLVTGSNAFSGILAALYAREKTGCGQIVDVSLMDSQFQMLNSVMEPILNGATEDEFKPFRHPLYKSRDGKTISINIGNPRNWNRIAQAIGEPNTQMPDSSKLTDALIRTWVANLSSQDLARRMEASGAPYGITLTAHEAASHPHFQDRRMIADVPDPIQGSIRAVNSPLFFSEIQSEATKAAPLIGQHTEIILHQIGLPDEKIEQLISAHAIFQLPPIAQD